MLCNDALLVKQLWRVITKPQLLMSRIIKSMPWWKVRWLLQKGLQVEVRNGTSLRIQDHNWVLGIINMGPRIKQEFSGKTMWVKDLIDNEINSWNVHKVAEVFEIEDCEVVMQIQTINCDTEERWRWTLHKTEHKENVKKQIF
ncbi:BTB/POZ domain-containing adapter forCUL3-mediated RhoA degradation protein 3 [Striga asiatica]|uniref:BTB/POZ domain-containing adapter forCUL3-mediated RhoA degradation protein 3 n=1 Tax=Striga asiatica TaxID=4170 RepID=A0A5A7P6K5_STRAF|nr:BTB/POZ domain-containing adapter forCUL3-mediated RhoA degradation protein 3 [Striga asiatica]